MERTDPATHEQARMIEAIRRFWDEDSATYDRAAGHAPRSPAVIAAWRASLSAILPAAPARVLDVGAGTGFLSLLAASLGHEVTALDLSEGMLDRLKENATRAGLSVSTVVASADDPPRGFEVIMERHLLWTLPEPRKALRAWREAAAEGRLVVVESIWGVADPVEALRNKARHLYRRLRGVPPDHHAEYDSAVRRSLPLGRGTPPAEVGRLVEDSGWPCPRLVRLRDVEWAEGMELDPLERALGVSPRYCVVAGA